MSIIEQAARRLEELRRSGIEPPGGARSSMPDAASRPSAPAALGPAGGVAAVKRLPVVEPVARTSHSVTIDLERLGAMGYMSPAQPRSQIADEFRVIKRPLLANLDSAHSREERNNLVMVTSSVPGEGKTFVSINLAVSLAMELDKTVLLVDADVSRPSVLSRLGLPQSRGLLDLLTDSSLGVSDVLLRTNIDKLTLLPAGRPHGQATELLSSEAMRRLLAEMATRYADRVLVFDAPPLLPSTESRVLAAQMGQVVMVVEANRTAHKTVEQALAAVEKCPRVMMLLNKIGQSEVGSYHGYYNPVET